MTAQVAAFTRGRGWAIGLIAAAILLYFFPLFHITSLEQAQQQAAAAEFDAIEYVDRFWSGPLLDATEIAVDARALLAGFQTDFDQTVERYGHRLGLGGSSSYLVSGQGTVVAVNDREVSIALGEGEHAGVVIRLGPVFGNAIRDGSGLIDVSDFANVQDFNAISAEINRRVEADVFPLIETHAAVGNVVRFIGGVEVSDSAGAPSELKLVPLMIEPQ